MDNLVVTQIVLEGNLNIVYCDRIFNMICVYSSFMKGAEKG